MATVCVLIGSFNNHPKWQTIGWIKYTCWLNYRCNVFTPTSHTSKRTVYAECQCISSSLSSLSLTFHSSIAQYLFGVSLSVCACYCFRRVNVFIALASTFLAVWEFERTKWVTMSHIYAAYVRMEYQHQRNWLSCLSFQYPLCGLIEEVGSTDGAFYSHRWQSNSMYVCVSIFFSLSFSNSLPMPVCVCECVCWLLCASFCFHFNQAKQCIQYYIFGNSCMCIACNLYVFVLFSWVKWSSLSASSPLSFCHLAPAHTLSHLPQNVHTCV